MNKELKDFKQNTRKRIQENIIKLRDTRGNFYLAIRMPTEDYGINNNSIPYEQVRSILCEKVREKETKSNI